MKMKRQVALLVISALLIGLLPMGNATISKAQQNPTSAEPGSASVAEETAGAGYGLDNPTKNSDGVSTWDCVWFGSYWQEDTNGDGKADKTDKKQPIKWRVLSVEGDDAFLLADKNLDCQRYNDTRTDVTWETCTMRSWLNGYGAESNKEGKDYRSGNFLDYAFTSTEQSAIRTINIVNDDNPRHKTEGGNDTSDKVYLLSIDEVMNPSYGFVSITDETKTRGTVNTGYVAAGGELKTGTIYNAGMTDAWWLRSPGYNSSRASSVMSNGYLYLTGDNVEYDARAARPALHLKLSSDLCWSYAGTVTSEGEEETLPVPGATEEPEQKPTASPGTEHSPLPTLLPADHSPENPTTDSDGVTTWDCVWFGNYWQEDTNGDRKTDKTDAKQPIKWRVLSVEGNNAFLLADKNLDCQRYNDIRTDVTWETCTMRSWLNGYGAGENQEGKDYRTDNFLANAFTPAEQSAIRTTRVVNDDNREYGIEGGNDTSDQVYLLSIDEVMNPLYGFSSTESSTKTRQAVNTSYVAGGGEINAYMNEAGSYDYWRLRSPGKSSSDTASVTGLGLVNRGYYVDYATIAVRPALHLNLSSDSSWSYAGRVTSEGEEIGVMIPTPKPTLAPSVTSAPTEKPGVTPTGKPTEKPTAKPTAPPTEKPGVTPAVQPTASPGTEHSPNPTAPSVTSVPTEKPGVTSTVEPSVQPTASSETEHSPNPTESPGMESSPLPTLPSVTSAPTEKPEVIPTVQPTDSPSVSPAATTEPGGESTMKPTTTATVPPTVKPTTTPETVTPFVPVSPSQMFTPVLQPTASPTVTSVGKVASIKLKQKKQTVTASWKKVPRAAGYQIWYSTSKKWKGKKQKRIRKNKVTVKKLKKKKIYYFRVRAYRLDGTKKVYGAWSKRKKIRIIKM